jgi:ABC-type nitrate/sulfonate/bicarbonate transport system substrate-binding protein
VPRHPPAVLVAVLAVLALAGCGRTSGFDRPNQDASLLLDGRPDAIDTGIYLATQRGYDEAEGVTLRVRPATDGVRALVSGRAEMAILDIDDLGRARQRGADLVGVMAVVQEPLRRRAGTAAFPGLVLCTTRAVLADRSAVVRATIRALQRGYAEAQDDPESAVAAMTTSVPGLDPAALSAQMDRVAPAFTAGAAAYGQLRGSALRAWAAWALRAGVLSRPPDLARTFDTTLVPTPPP